MTRIIFLLPLFFLQLVVIAQPPAETTNKQVFTVVETMPEFPGGDRAMIRFLEKNLKYPNAAKTAKTQGTVYVSFLVKQDGTIADANIVRGILGPGGKECGAEALRLVKLMPKWKPAIKNKKPVDVHYSLPVKFLLK